ncbi:MAG: winged helix-turn-helix transcriptional regulator [Anaerolineales bacterium]|nr:winged helix-turn-helix transcriptional regulator [Anaerolineales bacterium]
MKQVYKALADPTRRKILQLLRERDMNAGEIAEHFDHAKPTLSRHFNVLRNADLIQGDKQGNMIIYRLNVSVLEEALLAMMDMFQIDLNGLEERQNEQEQDA